MRSARWKTPAVDCDGFCRDECVAIAMIAACQHNACPAMRACAFSLLGCSMIDEVVQGAESFAATMRGADQVLLPAYVHGASLLAMRPPPPSRNDRRPAQQDPSLMIVCSCAVITDKDIEEALVEIMSLPDAPLPTPGVVYQHLSKKMVCCGCAPLAVSTIYEKIDQLAERGVICPYAGACAQGRLLKGARPPAQRLIERRPITSAPDGEADAPAGKSELESA